MLVEQDGDLYAQCIGNAAQGRNLHVEFAPLHPVDGLPADTAHAGERFLRQRLVYADLRDVRADDPHYVPIVLHCWKSVINETELIIIRLVDWKKHAVKRI